MFLKLFLWFCQSHHFWAFSSMMMVSRWLAVWPETQLDAILLSTSSGTSGPLSRTSKYRIQREDDLPQRYFQLWQECIFFLWHHEKRNERPEHWLPLRGGKSCCLPNCLPCFCLPSSSSLSGFFALKSPALHLAPVLNSPRWQLTKLLWSSSFQPLPSFSSGFGSRLGRVLKSVASSYTTHLETDQVWCPGLTGSRRIYSSS